MEREPVALSAAPLAELRSVAGDGPYGLANAASLPAGPGSYLLLIGLDRPLRLPIHGLSPARLATGWYAYAGSACGPGGLRARFGRHLRRGKVRRWHVDHLTEAAAALWAFPAPGARECDLLRALLARPGFAPAVPGFGSSDCRSCASHLLAAPAGHRGNP